MSIGTYEFWTTLCNAIQIKTSEGVIELGFIEDDILRLRFNPGERIQEEETFVANPDTIYAGRFHIAETSNTLLVESKNLRVSVLLDPLSIRVLDCEGNAIFSTTENMGELTVKSTIVRITLDPDEKIYGLGQDPMANLDQRGKERRMWQEWGGFRRSGNAGIPFYISSKGYGLLLNSSWPSRFAVGEAKVALPGPKTSIHWAAAPWDWEKDSGETNPDELSILLDSSRMDLFIICRKSVDEIHRGYVQLTGNAPMLPKWAFGFIQCKNRYRFQEEMLCLARKFREKRIPCDALVLDWLWFKEFGDLEWFKQNWPDPEGMLKELAAMGIRVVQAQHPYIERNSLQYNEFNLKGYLNFIPPDKDPDSIGNNSASMVHARPTFDHSNPEARRAWWNQTERLFNEGIRGYWTDMGELEEHPLGTVSCLGSRERVHNIYSTLWTKGLYDGQRSCSKERVFSLARTAYAGIQRNGAAMWSGDVDSTWEVLREQVAIGQGVCLSGQQFWCTDIGGFFTDERFSAELYVRWFQWGAFCPIFRTHGTRPDNEPWSFGEQAESIIKEFINLRYQLMPYIYSCARKVTESGTPIMRAMCADFAKDDTACAQKDQFMFGPALLVAPVLEENARTRKLYLPEGIWYDFWTGEKYTGKRWIDVLSPLSAIPLFAKAGSIIPMGPVLNYTDETPLDTIDLRVYAGSQGSFDLYEDDGKTYAYENGEYVKTALSVDESGEVAFGEITGKKELIPDNRQYNIIVHDGKGNNKIIALGNNKMIGQGNNRMIGQPMEIYSDTNMSCDGICTISIMVKNISDAEIDLKAFLKVATGWKLFPRVTDEKTAKIKDYHLLQWKVIPCAEALPLINHGTVELEIKWKECTSKTREELTWGSAYSTRWHIIGNFNNEDNKGLDNRYEIEENADSPFYSENGQKHDWERNTINEYNCFGYVEFSRPPVSPNITNALVSQGVAYAKCSIWSEEDTIGFMDISGDPCIKIWINGELKYESYNIVLKQVIHTPVSLKKGWNKVLVKSALFCEKPYSGREFGFSFRIVEKSGKVMDKLLYKP